MEDWEIRQIEKDKMRAIEASNRQQEEAVRNQKEHFDRMENIRREELKIQEKKLEEARATELQKQKNDKIAKLKSKIEKLELTWAKERDSEARSRIQLLLFEAQNELEDYLETCRLEEELERQRQEEIAEKQKIAQERYLHEQDQEAKRIHWKRNITIVVSLLSITVLLFLFQQIDRNKNQNTNSSTATTTSSTNVKTNVSTSTSTKMNAVPNVKGMTLVIGTQKIKAAGFVVGEITEKNSKEVEAGVIISTNPVANTSKVKGSKIDVVVSKGIAKKEVELVPEVIGKSLDEAESLLEAAGFVVGTVTEKNSEEVETGLVISTDPVANTSKTKGSKVNLVVSKGIEMSVVPDVRGQKLDTAKSALKSAGFKVGTTTEENSDELESGLVISTDPARNTEIAKGSTVNLVVSKGVAIVMPDFGSLQVSYTEARRQLQALGVSVSNIEKMEDTNSPATTADLVVSQYPAAGQKVDGTVTLYVTVAVTSKNDYNSSTP